MTNLTMELQNMLVRSAHLLSEGFNAVAQDTKYYIGEIQRLEAENLRLQKIINTHDMCHNLHGQVDARAFADGCAAEQRKLYGFAPDADAVAGKKYSDDLAEAVFNLAIKYGMSPFSSESPCTYLEDYINSFLQHR